MYKVIMRLVIVMMMVMMIMMMMTVMMMTKTFNSLALQVAYDDGEVISERIIYRYLEGDLYIET